MYNVQGTVQENKGDKFKLGASRENSGFSHLDSKNKSKNELIM